MIVNRSVPRAVVIPVLTYEDVAEASEWLCRAFGFKERLRVGNHRVQLIFGDGAVIITAGRRARGNDTDPVSHAVHVRIDDADRPTSKRSDPVRGSSGADGLPLRRTAIQRRRPRGSPLDVLAIDRGGRSDLLGRHRDSVRLADYGQPALGGPPPPVR